MEKNIEINELKQIQLNILNFVDAFCKKNNLKYFLAYGTLLGAVRHNGYIPWDDDIDILMFREDYEKLIMTFKDSRYKVFATETNPKYPYPFAKIGDTKTYFEEEIKDVIDTGVNIDIFPLDYLPENKIKGIVRREMFLQKIWTFKRLPKLRRRGILKNFFLSIVQLILSPIPIRIIVRKMEENAKKYTLNKSLICGNVSLGYESDIYKVTDFKEQVELKFEDNLYPCPKEYDSVLSAVFGDYMQLPPKEKRVSHHHFVAYWK